MKALFVAVIISSLLAQSVSRAAEPSQDAQQREQLGGPAGGQVACGDGSATVRQCARFLRAKVHISEGKYREALAEIEAIHAETPEEESLRLILLGQSCEGLPDLARAVDAYQKAHSLGSLGSAALLRQAVFHYNMADRLKAHVLFRRYVKIEGGNPEAYYYLFLLESEESERATAARRLVALDGPDGFWTRRLLKATAEEVPGATDE